MADQSNGVDIHARELQDLPPGSRGSGLHCRLLQREMGISRVGPLSWALEENSFAPSEEEKAVQSHPGRIVQLAIKAHGGV